MLTQCGEIFISTAVQLSWNCVACFLQYLVWMWDRFFVLDSDLHTHTHLCHNAISLISTLICVEASQGPHSLEHTFPEGSYMLSTMGQGVLWTNGYYNLALHFSQDRTKQEPNKTVGEKCRNSIALLQRMRTKPWLSLFALCCLQSVLLVFVYFLFLLWFFLALCCYSRCPLLSPFLLLIFKLKGVLLESNRNAAQFCSGME